MTEVNSALEKRIKKHVIGKPHRFMAVAPLGFEETLVKELEYVGVECADSDSGTGIAGIKIAGDGKVEFTAKLTEAWKAVAYSRIANRILMEVSSFKAENFGQLEKGVSAIPWELYLPDAIQEGAAESISETLSIHVTCKHSRLYHSDAVEERIRNVIGPRSGSQSSAKSHCEQSEAIEAEPSYSLQNLYVTLQDDRCTLWLDLAGEELYKRGHERFVAEAPLKETIAAAMIFEATQLARNVIASDNVAKQSKQDQPAEHITILDGMAGSGTFSLEAAYVANGLIPGKCRDFALKHQPAFKEGTWNFILKGANTAQPAVTIITSDISQRPIDIIRHNVECSPLPAGVINPQLKDFFSYNLSDIIANGNFSNVIASDNVAKQSKQAQQHENIILLLNPPYGKRLAFDAPKLYTKIGQKLTEFAGRVALSCSITVAILAPKDCTQNLLQACPALDPRKNGSVKLIETSHGGFSLNAIFAKI